MICRAQKSKKKTQTTNCLRILGGGAIQEKAKETQLFTTLLLSVLLASQSVLGLFGQNHSTQQQLVVRMLNTDNNKPPLRPGKKKQS